MRWKAAINGVLHRAGYKIVKAHRAPTSKPPAKPPAPEAKPPAKPQPRRPEFPGDYDESAKETIRAVRPFTMTPHQKIFPLILATRYVCRHKIPGAIVECGVWRGGSMQAVARTLLEQGHDDRELYLFDTFEGMPPPTEKDVRHDGKPAADLLAAASRNANIWAVASFEDVKAGLEAIPYPQERIHYVQGLVEDTVPAKAPGEIAILRLDTDWYESTKHELIHLYRRIASGGVLIIDDYGQWLGSRQATHEFVDEIGDPLLLTTMGSGRIAVKP